METYLEKKWYVACFLMLLAILLVSTPAYAQKKIKVGVMGAMKSWRGEMTWNGAQLAAEEINAAGGVMVGGVKHEVELIKADTNEYMSIPDAISTIRRLATVDKVNFLVGVGRSEAALAMQEVMSEYKMIWSSSGVASPVLNERVAKDYNKYKYWFKFDPAFFTNHVLVNSVNVAADKFKGEVGVTTPRVALLIEKTIWSDPVLKLAEELLPKMGMEIVGVWRPSPAATDLLAELTAIKNAGAHITLNTQTGTTGIVLGKQWGELKIPSALIGLNGEGFMKDYWENTGKMCNYEAVYSHVNRVRMSSKTIPFWDKYEARFKKWATIDSFNYDALYVFTKAAERAGTLDPDALVTEIEKTDMETVLGRLVLHPKEDWVKDPKLAHSAEWGPGRITSLVSQWQDGKFACVWPDGRSVLGDKRWIGFRHEGTVDYKLAPWVIDYWKGRRQ